MPFGIGNEIERRSNDRSCSTVLEVEAGEILYIGEGRALDPIVWEVGDINGR